MNTIFLGIVIFLCLLAIFDLVVGVSNDAVNFLNSAIGAKVVSMIFELLGGAFAVAILKIAHGATMADPSTGSGQAPARSATNLRSQSRPLGSPKGMHKHKETLCTTKNINTLLLTVHILQESQKLTSNLRHMLRGMNKRACDRGHT